MIRLSNPTTCRYSIINKLVMEETAIRILALCFFFLNHNKRKHVVKDQGEAHRIHLVCPFSLCICFPERISHIFTTLMIIQSFIVEYVSDNQYRKSMLLMGNIAYIRISASSSQDSCGVIIFKRKNGTRASANSCNTHIGSNIPHLNCSIMCSCEDTFAWKHLDTTYLHNSFGCSIQSEKR